MPAFAVVIVKHRLQLVLARKFIQRNWPPRRVGINHDGLSRLERLNKNAIDWLRIFKKWTIRGVALILGTRAI